MPRSSQPQIIEVEGDASSEPMFQEARRAIRRLGAGLDLHYQFEPMLGDNGLWIAAIGRDLDQDQFDLILMNTKNTRAERFREQLGQGFATARME